MHVDANTIKMVKLADELLGTVWESCPVEATLLGVHDFDHTLGDVSSYALTRYGRKFRYLASTLRSCVDPSKLCPELRMDYYLALSIASSYQMLLEHRQYWRVDPSHYASLCIWGSFSLLLRGSRPLEERLEAMCSRMSEIPDVLASARENLKHPSSVAVQVASEVLDGGIPFFKEVVPGLASLRPALRPSLLAANDTAVAALESFASWLKDDLYRRADGNFRLGYDAYQQMLASENYLTHTPNELVSLAENTILETNAMIRDVAQRIDPSVPWVDLINRLKEDHPPKDRLLDAYRDAMYAARRFVLDRDLVTIPEDERLEISPTPEFERNMLPWGAYFPPAPYGTGKSAFFWVTTADDSLSPEEQEARLAGHCTHTIPIIALHETYPGHHLQLTRLIDVKSPVAKLCVNSLMMEGWALYCEEMMREQGFCADDPRVHLFQLRDVLWRAHRVLIDVGLHAGDMSIHDAVRMLVEKAFIDETSAEVEVKRYTLSPTQPMSYAVGKQMMLDLREGMRLKLGSRFSLKSFHDQVLSYGSIPLPLIAGSMLNADVQGQSEDSIRLSA